LTMFASAKIINARRTVFHLKMDFIFCDFINDISIVYLRVKIIKIIIPPFRSEEIAGYNVYANFITFFNNSATSTGI